MAFRTGTMIRAKLPENETSRLAFLKQLGILDSPAEERFDRITRIACQALNVPIAAISLIDEDRQWFKSIQGLLVAETPRNIAFCAHAILEECPFVVSDALLDKRFSSNPLVTSEPGIRYYAGCPLDMGNGLRVGTLCAIDRVPKETTESHLQILSDLTDMVRSELQSMLLSEAHQRLLEQYNEAKRAALVDPLTGLWNRAGGDALFHREWHNAIRGSNPITVASLDLDHFKSINDEHGHDVGDQALQHVANTITSLLRAHDIACRWGGEEFLIVVPGCGPRDAQTVLNRIVVALKSTPIPTATGTLTVTASMGATTAIPERSDLRDSMLKVADEALYAAKQQGRDRLVIHQPSKIHRAIDAAAATMPLASHA